MKVFIARWSDGFQDEAYGVFSSIDSFLQHIKSDDPSWYYDGMEVYHEKVNSGQDPALDKEYIEDYFGITLEEHELQL